MTTTASHKAVIFDLYGTLVDFTQPLNPYKRLLSQGPATPEFREAVMCRDWSIAKLVQELALGTSAENIAACTRDIAREMAGVFVYPEVFEVLQRLKDEGHRLVLCSNLAPAYASVLETSGLGKYFDLLQLSFRSGRLKPDPLMFLQPLEALGISPSRAVMVGDSFSSDVQGAEACSVAAVHLQRKKAGEPQAIADLRQAYSQITALLARTDSSSPTTDSLAPAAASAEDFPW